MPKQHSKPSVDQARVQQVTLRHTAGTSTVAAQRTRCPHLVIVVEFWSRGFTGGFTALHVPSGWMLQTLAWEGQLSPSHVEAAIGRVAALDWSSSDKDHYKAPHYRAAWFAALTDVTRETDDQEPG